MKILPPETAIASTVPFVCHDDAGADESATALAGHAAANPARRATALETRARDRTPPVYPRAPLAKPGRQLGMSTMPAVSPPPVRYVRQWRNAAAVSSPLTWRVAISSSIASGVNHSGAPRMSGSLTA
jgi:hypothetical protein